MTDAVDSYMAASKTNDVDRLLGALAPDVELVSPLSSRMVFRGPDLRALLGAVYGILEHVQWHQRVSGDSMQVVVGSARVGPLTLEDAMVLELDRFGQIRRIRPHLRPWLATTLFAMKLAPHLVRQPRVLMRARKHKQ